MSLIVLGGRVNSDQCVTLLPRAQTCSLPCLPSEVLMHFMVILELP